MIKELQNQEGSIKEGSTTPALMSLSSRKDPLSTGSASSALSNKLKGLRTGLKSTKVPAIVMDSKLNIIWENPAYISLFNRKSRHLPVNLVKDFSPYITPERLGKIYSSITDKRNGFSYTCRMESKWKDRMPIVANMLITPLFNTVGKERENTPVLFVAFFDDISNKEKELLKRTFLSLLEASKLKDNDTGYHIKRVGEYSHMLAKTLYDNRHSTDLNIEFVENILFLAPMHDVGKIGTPDDILNKEGPLDAKEWVIMREHTKNGAYILEAYPDIMAKNIALFHHEKWDGNGYPFGIERDTIPLEARIVAIADVYDALRMKRSYKKSFSHEKSVEIIKKDSGTHFDPELVEYFLRKANIFEEIYEKLKDSP